MIFNKKTSTLVKLFNFLNKKQMAKVSNTAMILSSAGALAGLYMAYKGKKSALGYVGFFLLGSIAGGLAGNIVDGIVKPKSTETKGKTFEVTLPSIEETEE